MKKVIYTQFGTESVLQLQELPVPTITENQLLIQVKSVSINPLDWKIYGGEMKMMSGKKFPKGVGIDFSGIVESIGSNSTTFKKGDPVFGLLDVFKGGALAEYISVTEKDIALKPDTISFEQAASLPVTGLSALQITDKLAAIGKGQEVLINGASGGIGLFVIQLAKQRKATVTAVTGNKGIDLAKKLGADHVMDYAKQNILSLQKKYDVVIDLSGKMSFSSGRKLLKAKGVFIHTIPSPAGIVGSFIHNLFSAQKHKILILKPFPAGLSQLAQLATNNLEILVSKVYTIQDVRKAYRETAGNGVLGKAVINVQ